MWLAAFIALVGILLVFDRVAHADPVDPEPELVPDLADADDPVAPILDEADATADDLRASELTGITDPAWLVELADGEDRDNQPRHARPSRFGRIDLALAWRHFDRDPRTLDPYGGDVIVVVATWRR